MDSEKKTLGVLGGGQLGKMFADAAHKLGFRVVCYTPENNSPASKVADKTFVGKFDNSELLNAFAKEVSAVTIEFENIPTSALETLAKSIPTQPRAFALGICQDRLKEKNWLKANGFPVTPFAEVSSNSQLLTFALHEGFPCILKTAGQGYDGKGQTKLESTRDIEKLNPGVEFAEKRIIEKFVPFTKEFSVIGARDEKGNIVLYDPIENSHKNHILDVSIAPAEIPSEAVSESKKITEQILVKLDYRGVLCVEFFLGKSVVVNEIAPRPHNSGHLTIEASETSQFEQQVRALAGLPLGKPILKQPATMVNLLGDLWNQGEPLWKKVAKHPNAHLHLYGKSVPKPARKMGHITLLGKASEAIALRDSLTKP
jgi:5-(carboxyamino)imidazole ribonucleotide synthase